MEYTHSNVIEILTKTIKTKIDPSYCYRGIYVALCEIVKLSLFLLKSFLLCNVVGFGFR